MKQSKKELRLQLENSFNDYAEYEELWDMFRTVIKNSSWGTSEFGGPVWIMDFSLANLKKLFPDSLWLAIMEEERAHNTDEFGNVASDLLRIFSDWFYIRADKFITQQGLGNVLVKQEVEGYRGKGNISFYGYGIFLDILGSLVGGKVNCLSQWIMEHYSFSVKEERIIKEKTFFTCLEGGFKKQFPDGSGSGIHHYRESESGNCYKLEHFSLTKGYVVPETQPEKFITLIVNDLMECKAQGYGNKTDANGNVCPYPQMKYDTYIDFATRKDKHFCPTKSEFRWQRTTAEFEEIIIELPKINPEHKQFWHRQFPMKQNWRELPE